MQEKLENIFTHLWFLFFVEKMTQQILKNKYQELFFLQKMRPKVDEKSTYLTTY